MAGGKKDGGSGFPGVSMEQLAAFVEPREQDSSADGVEDTAVDTPDAAEDGSDTSTRLQERLARLESERQRDRDDWRRREEAYHAQLLQAAGASRAAAAPEGAKLPDPVEDPEGFRKAVVAEAEQRAAALLEQRHAVQTEQARLDALWGRFRAQHADLAEDEVALLGVAQREVDRLRASGLDPRRFMLEDGDEFLRRIADGVRAYWQGDSRRASSRTGGIPGGSRGGSVRRQTVRDSEVPGDFVAEIKAERERLGI